MGLTLTFFGVLFLLENLGVSDGLAGKYWPVILIILGVASVFNIFRYKARFNRFGRDWPPRIDE